MHRKIVAFSVSFALYLFLCEYSFNFKNYKYFEDIGSCKFLFMFKLVIAFGVINPVMMVLYVCLHPWLIDHAEQLVINAQYSLGIV